MSGTMLELLDAVVAGLATEFDGGANVVKYERLSAPSTLTVYVAPDGSDSEGGYAVGNVFRRVHRVFIVVEAPWRDDRTPGDGILGAVETIIGWIGDNRLIGTELDEGRHEAVDYRFVERPGVAKPAYAAFVRARWETIDEREEG